MYYFRLKLLKYNFNYYDLLFKFVDHIWLLKSAKIAPDFTCEIWDLIGDLSSQIRFLRA